jgi:hypothetical protein
VVGTAVATGEVYKNNRAATLPAVSIGAHPLALLPHHYPSSPLLIHAGAAVGAFVGVAVGAFVGAAVVGAAVGAFVGAAVGALVGTGVGAAVATGAVDKIIVPRTLPAPPTGLIALNTNHPPDGYPNVTLWPFARASLSNTTVLPE